MRKLIIAAPAVLLLAACTSNYVPPPPPIVSWSYGAGNGDGVKYPGPPPKYSFSYGAGADVPVNSGSKPTMSYGYGAEGTTGDMVQMATPTPNQQVAQPVQAPATSHHI